MSVSRSIRLPSHWLSTAAVMTDPSGPTMLASSGLELTRCWCGVAEVTGINIGYNTLQPPDLAMSQPLAYSLSVKLDRAVFLSI
jgi:hypothetical protein